MFGFLKNLLRKLVETPVENEELTAPEFEPAPEPTGWEAQPEPDALRPHQKAVCQNGKGVELSLEAVLRGLPLELQPRIRSCWAPKGFSSPMCAPACPRSSPSALESACRCWVRCVSTSPRLATPN